MRRLLALPILCALLCGCIGSDPVFRESIVCMDTVIDITLWGDDTNGAATYTRELLKQLERDWDPNSDSSVIAGLNSGEAELDPEQTELIQQIGALSQWTGGAFDPKLYAVTQAWGFPTDEYRVPTQAELDEALSAELWDLGAAMKGYAARRCVEYYQETDLDRALLNLGGTVQTYGEKEDGSPWMIGILSPFGNSTVGTVSVYGTMSIVTSGDYQRYFELEGQRYYHILDPETGYPADSGLSSVTVICDDGLTADVLSTALFVMGLEEASAFWRENTGFEAVFVLTSGDVYATEGADLSGCTFEVIAREE